MNEIILLPISELSQVGDARRQALALVKDLGFSKMKQGQVGIVVTEMASNLVYHAHDGTLLIQTIEQNQRLGLEIISLDKGPGIENISECLQDGYSTKGTAGNGLGAISRLSNCFEIYSDYPKGTALLVQMWDSSSVLKNTKERLVIGGICLPKKGEEVSGDSWATIQQPHRTLFMVADGLGHGFQAAQASLEAVRIFREQENESPKAIIEAAHQALRNTRGAALAVTEIDFERQSLRFAGVGNISGAVFTAQGNYSMVSYNGIVGYEMRKLQEFTYQWPKDGVLIMHSDGLTSHWRLDNYRGLAAKHSSLIAGVLYRDFHRGRDDVTVLVAKERTEDE
ncbi:SpoIIE family protein phosphatase [Chroococcus sp. FPU101]|uniref:ATP-binding SpoIIE family protein phosphatase n=1 Tax=Chroococcus sp. FPU101 TaxID=1974212 RepID=UPI001A90AC4B|nr:SpoIIE family protein phosphatase [Chroococcus sp. FPU101]GFE68963.1 putative anti-sigma regulatory factor, serine/threonine protein kinase [Chroococcus sp. FPU101]